MSVRRGVSRRTDSTCKSERRRKVSMSIRSASSEVTGACGHFHGRTEQSLGVRIVGVFQGGEAATEAQVRSSLIGARSDERRCSRRSPGASQAARGRAGQESERSFGHDAPPRLLTRFRQLRNFLHASRGSGRGASGLVFRGWRICHIFTIATPQSSSAP